MTASEIHADPNLSFRSKCILLDQVWAEEREARHQVYWKLWDVMMAAKARAYSCLANGLPDEIEY